MTQSNGLISVGEMAIRSRPPQLLVIWRFSILPFILLCCRPCDLSLFDKAQTLWVYYRSPIEWMHPIRHDILESEIPEDVRNPFRVLYADETIEKNYRFLANNFLRFRLDYGLSASLQSRSSA